MGGYTATALLRLIVWMRYFGCLMIFICLLFGTKFFKECHWTFVDQEESTNMVSRVTVLTLAMIIHD